MNARKLSALRKTKGLSQEELATLSGVSARTIQRIEKGMVQPHPVTLKLLADSLGVGLESLTEPDIVPEGQTAAKENGVLVLFHAAALIGLFFPVLNILLPSLLWWYKKDGHPEYDDAGRQVINFQLSMSFAFVPALALLIFYFPIGFPLVLLIYFYNLVLCLVNLFKAINHHPAKYPLSFPFLQRKPMDDR